MRFDELDLAPVLQAGIGRCGFTALTPVQQQALPLALAGRDVAAQAQTGTGKTAAFLIALYNRLLAQPGAEGPAPRALILAPTRELVMQIAADAEALAGDAPLRLLQILGGIDYDRQRKALLEGADILVATPGRLIDYVRQKVCSFEQIQMLVIDEADRMFDMGFIQDLRFILRRLPPFSRRQTMLFSATLSHRVMELAYDFMNQAVRVEIAPEQVTAANIEELVYHVGYKEKIPLLLGLLRGPLAGGKVMVFANTKRETERVAGILQANEIRAALISGDLNQRRRMKILQQFKENQIDVLVATDVASRGIHVDDVTHVVNYDVPQDVEDYVHRIGRTARAGASGLAIMMADEELVYALPAIEDYIGHKIPHDVPEETLFCWQYQRPAASRRRRGPTGTAAAETKAAPSTGRRRRRPTGRPAPRPKN
ncbi:DEAD/DEAH box helicase [Desulfuromonas thiophila]|uniref:DEAD/DEAH box helicase n=1 Tax=Desulfuromonas thiophila TaxID=57664 RepID=UPI0024A7D240|nr:DEAD/DEAH box helicase [Desulfuromonas thiophila]